MFDGKAPVVDWKAPMFVSKTPAFGGRVPVFVWKMSVFGQEVVDRTRTVVLAAGEGGLAGAARGFQPAMAALRAAQGRATPPSRPWWALGRCPHKGLARF